MTGSARDSLIAIAVLWVIFAITVGFRFLGRLRGIGLGLDDILSAVALVSHLNMDNMLEQLLMM